MYKLLSDVLLVYERVGFACGFEGLYLQPKSRHPLSHRWPLLLRWPLLQPHSFSRIRATERPRSPSIAAIFSKQRKFTAVTHYGNAVCKSERASPKSNI